MSEQLPTTGPPAPRPRVADRPPRVDDPRTGWVAAGFTAGVAWCLAVLAVASWLL